MVLNLVNCLNRGNTGKQLAFAKHGKKVLCRNPQFEEGVKLERSCKRPGRRYHLRQQGISENEGSLQ